MPAPEELERSTAPLPWLVGVLLVVALVVGASLRLDQLERRGLGTDEGSYLQSAQLHELDPDSPPGDWLAEDLAWLGVDHAYPHSYLHQWTARLLHRAGFSFKAAIRLGSVVTGVLSVLALFAFLRRARPGHPWVALLASALLAVGCLHVWYARTGWGSTSSTFFWLVYLALGWELLRAESPGARVALGLGLALSSLAAYGFHEMMSVYVVSMGLALLLCGLAGGERAPWRSGRLWTWALASVPVGLLTVWILLFSDFAQEHWFDTVRGEVGYLEARLRTLDFLVLDRQGLLGQLSWPVVFLALVGVGRLGRRARMLAVFLLANTLGGFLLFFLFFQDANLIRIHLPSACIGAYLAAEGLVELVERVRRRTTADAGLAGRTEPGGPALLPALGLLLALALVGYEAARTRDSTLGGPEDLCFDRAFHRTPASSLLASSEEREAVVVEHLRAELMPGEEVRTIGFTPKFFLRDAGIDATSFQGPPRRFVVGRQAEGSAKLTKRFGADYQVVPLAGDGFWTLFERKGAAR